MGNISLKSPSVFSGWAFHDIPTHFVWKRVKYFNGILVTKSKNAQRYFLKIK
ncbi:hypothetical protein HPSA50_1788 [Helicobacter pylori SouthAfrica50]|uniref:Uncharacterized protein n=1 Tax=Helicobacter pylori SouthAfrica50 TaxID=1352357 RepID=T2SA12_HELPX|nr:hypothetical protein HPSA50_1788 [Helicobacter pylori SouthAfrica50]